MDMNLFGMCIMMPFECRNPPFVRQRGRV